MPSYDRALWALRKWLDSWPGIGPAVDSVCGASRLLCARLAHNVLHHRDGPLLDERDGHRVGRTPWHAMQGGVGGIEKGVIVVVASLILPLGLLDGYTVLVWCIWRESGVRRLRAARHATLCTTLCAGQPGGPPGHLTGGRKWRNAPRRRRTSNSTYLLLRPHQHHWQSKFSPYSPSGRRAVRVEGGG